MNADELAAIRFALAHDGMHIHEAQYRAWLAALVAEVDEVVGSLERMLAEIAKAQGVTP